MEVISISKPECWSRTWSADISESLYLMPGALYIGNEVKEVKTLLGSCVAVTLWHPRDKVCAMTHIVLPSNNDDPCNPRFATGAIHHLTQTIKQHGYHPGEFITGIYGGGRMFGNDNSPRVLEVGDTNVKKTSDLLKKTGFNVREADVLGGLYRHIILDRNTGMVSVKRTHVSATMG